MNAFTVTRALPMNAGLSSATVPTQWAPDSWQQHEALQQPQYDDAAELAAAEVNGFAYFASNAGAGVLGQATA